MVRIAPDTGGWRAGATEYRKLQKKINEMFPNSMVQLIPVADKLIVRGQARDPAEATQILSVLSGQAGDQKRCPLGPGSLDQHGNGCRAEARLQ